MGLSDWYRFTLQWCHSGRNGVSNNHPHHCLLNRLFRGRSKKIWKLRVTGLCAGNSSVIGEFPAQMGSDAENVSIWWRHHASCKYNHPKAGAPTVHWEQYCLHDYPADTLRNDDVGITSKRRHFDVIASKWRRFDVITTLFLRHAFGDNRDVEIFTIFFLYQNRADCLLSNDITQILQSIYCLRYHYFYIVPASAIVLMGNSISILVTW